MSFLGRERITEDGKRTYGLIRTTPEVVDKPILNKGVSVLAELNQRGFIESDKLTRGERRVIINPFLNHEPATPITIQGVASTHAKGGIKFSALDFFGRQLLEMYYVVDPEKFRSYMGAKLGRQFCRQNPHADQGLRRAFTRFMHGYQMHWSGCRERRPAH